MDGRCALEPRSQAAAGSQASRSNPNNPKLPPHPEQRQMLRALLAGRFSLKYRRQTKEGPVYLLAKGDKPPQLQPAKDEAEYPWVGGPSGGGILGNGIAAANATMELLASRLARYVGRPVIDRPPSIAPKSRARIRPLLPENAPSVRYSLFPSTSRATRAGLPSRSSSGKIAAGASW